APRRHDSRVANLKTCWRSCDKWRCPIIVPLLAGPSLVWKQTPRKHGTNSTNSPVGCFLSNFEIWILHGQARKSHGSSWVLRRQSAGSKPIPTLRSRFNPVNHSPNFYVFLTRTTHSPQTEKNWEGRRGSEEQGSQSEHLGQAEDEGSAGRQPGDKDPIICIRPQLDLTDGAWLSDRVLVSEVFRRRSFSPWSSAVHRGRSASAFCQSTNDLDETSPHCIRAPT